ncbi:MAG: hypothetical protein IT435_05095 [Phycisphaerales bacterium]|nr:hypothetical protein [Phycisphaerales bacterium]
MPDPSNKSIARSLGQFFGHIFHGIKADPAKRVVRKDVQTEERQTSMGKVVLRRTTVEEIELRPEAARERRGDGEGA